MLINPLKVKAKETENNIEVNKDKVISNIISYLIKNYSEYLSDIDMNKELVESIVREKVYKEYSNMNTETTITAILDRLFGYHILQKYIDDETVSDIRVTRFDSIFVKRNGKWEQAVEKFENENEYIDFVRYCVLKNRGKISNETPIVIVSDRKNNLRIEAGIEPVNVTSPNLVIRIHRPNGMQALEDLLMTSAEMINVDIYKFLSEAIIAGCNIVISGKGGSGKTTLMRTLINKIPEDLSITANEETAELYSTHPNLIQREILSNRVGDKNITLEKLTAHSLVMSNDVIVIGELKGAEAMSFFDAVSTGHRGYATVHADSSESTLDRLVTLMKRDSKAQMYSNDYLTKLLSMSLDLIVYMNNFKVQEIAEVVYNKEDEKIEYNPLYEFEVEKIENGKSIGRFKKVNNPIGTVKRKIEISKPEIERCLA